MSDKTVLNSPTFFPQDISNDENFTAIEFRSPEDEAWYSVEVSDICDALMVSFNGSTYREDEFYPSDDFKNVEEIQEFEERFRAASEQMQDEDCPKVNECTKVCAICPSVSGEVKFYDAIVVAVERTKHEVDDKGSEACDCNFKLFWKQGPCLNQVTTAKVGDICLRPNHNRMNPKVVSFVKEARRKLSGESINEGEETQWQKIIKKGKSSIQNYNLSDSVSGI